MIESVKKHWLALILALILGALMVLPFFYFEAKLGKGFKEILPDIVNDESFYYARVKDVVDGHSFLGNAYLLEHKNELTQSGFLAEYLLAQPLKLFGIGINMARLIYNFLLPAIAFILAYSAFYLILKKRSWALAFSSFLFFGLYLLPFIRPVSPQFNFIFWLTQFIFLWLLVNSHDNTNTRMYANDTNKSVSQIRVIRINKFVSLVLLSANVLNFGLLFYIYPYYWTFYLIFLVLLTAIYFFNNRVLSYKILSIAGGGLVLAIPYFYLNYLSSKLPYYTETLTRLGMIYTRFPSGVRIFFWSALILAVFGWFLRRKIINWNTKTQFFIVGILASMIAVNQHLITGRNIEFSSHYDMGAMFFIVFVLAYLISQYNANLQMHASDTNRFLYLKLILIIIVLTVVVNGLCGYSNQVLAAREGAVYIQNYAPVFEWLNKNTPKDSVVYANHGLSRLIPVYTANNVFFVRDANLFYISDSEVLDKFILNNFFEKFNDSFITENVRQVYGVRYVDAYGHAVQGNKLRGLLGLKLESEVYFPNEAIQRVVTRAEELQKGDFIKEIKKYRVDYLIWDKNKNPDWKLNSANFQPIFQRDNLIIFKII